MRCFPVLLLASCSLVTSPSNVPESWEATVKEQWAIAAQDLEREGVPRQRIDSVQKHEFSWKEHQGSFDCGGVEANGCYRTGLGKHDSVEWNKNTPHVLQHEIGHGILHKLGYDCWKDYQHTEKGCP